MLDYTGIVVSDLAKARRFHDAMAAALDLATRSNSPESFPFGRSAEEPHPYFRIGTTRPSEDYLSALHHPFIAPGKDAVGALHRAAIGEDADDNGAPDLREGVSNHYGAFMLNPDGTNMEGCVRGAQHARSGDRP
ncbi:hypothetical protein [Pseudotabrizicola sp. 4114]|uniref:hypothetical protein n=1 Tax=Pseudotabrizicola sp. 4114 TaxID=2817731 RepID=UPI002862B409|nr:hypothetical protein [Pseudorhodobacter sp. 4114]